MSALRLFGSVVMLTTLIMGGAGLCNAQPMPGQPAPHFSLKDTNGVPHDFSMLNKQAMSILYFFDAESRPSQEGLLAINQLVDTYADADLAVWGLTLSSREKVKKFVDQTKVNFPILLDTMGVSDLYQAHLILPTVYILGPQLKVLDFFQGGGKTTEIMLVRLAGRQLQRKQPVIAKAISDQVIKKNPTNSEAKAVRGYAALQEGKTEEAEKVFKGLSRMNDQGEVLGAEGLAAVYADSGKVEKALEMVQAVEKKAPERSYVHVIKGNVLYAHGKKSAAEAEYKKGVQKTEGEPFQKALAYNQYGRLYATQGKYRQSRELYKKAIDIDPYYIEATSNIGVTYEKEGKWDNALKTYRQVLSLDKNDTFAAVLAQKAQEMLNLQKDLDKSKRINKLVKELSERYRSQQQNKTEDEDTWTSRPMIMSFVDFQEKGGLAERDGFSVVLTSQLASQLNASGRVRVVERVLMDRLLEELNLGSSELANPETALKLGKVLAAKVIGTGSLFYTPEETLMSLRLLDTETSAIPKVITKEFSSDTSLDKELNTINREILKTIIVKYPLQGYVVQAQGNEVMINLGSNQGVVLGTKFEIIEEQKPIQYKGKMLRSLPKKVGQIEIERVEPDLCYARILSKERPIRSDDKVKEEVDSTVNL